MNRQRVALTRGIVIAILAVVVVAGIGLAYSTRMPQTTSASTTTNQSTSQNQTSTNTNPAAPPNISQYCKLPLISSNSSSGITMTISNPLCGYYTSPVLYGGSVGMVSNESFDFTIQGPPLTEIQLTVPTTPFGAAWFTGGPDVVTDSQGEANTTLYLAGMWSNPQIASNFTVGLEAIRGPLGVSLKIPVVESSTVTELNPVSAIALPAHLFIEPANYSNGISYRTPFGVVYLPTLFSLPSLNLSMSVIGLASGNATSMGQIQPMPSGLSVWFADGQGTRESSLTVAPGKVEFIFLTSNTTLDLSPDSPTMLYHVAIQMTENGTSFTEVATIVLQPPQSTGGPAP